MTGRYDARYGAILTSLRHTEAMGMARIYKKGQITLPKEVREAAGLDVGARVVIEARGEEVVIRKPLGVLEFEPPQPDRAPLPWPSARRAAQAERTSRHVRGEQG